MTLDMRRGALLSDGHHLRSPDLGLRVRTLRLVSLSDRAVGLQLIQLEIEHGVGRCHVRSVVRRGGTRARNRPARSGSRRCGTPSIRAKRLAMATASSLQIDGHDLAPTALGPLNGPGAGKPALGRSCVSSALVAIVRSDTPDLDPGRRSPGQTRPCATHRLARRGRGARGRLGKPLAVQRCQGRGRRGRTAGLAVRCLPPQQRGQPSRRARLDRCPRADRRRLSWPRLLGHRDLPAAVLYPDLARSGPNAADVSLPHP